MRTRRTWYAVAIVLVGLSVLLLLTKGLNGGIEFRGGSEFRVSDVTTTAQEPAEQAVASVVPDGEPPRISSVGENAVRVQTERLSQEQTDQVATRPPQGYGVQPASVTSSFVARAGRRRHRERGPRPC